MTDLTLEVKQLLIDVLNLEDLQPDDIDINAPLFGTGLGLDSIDALEIGVALKKRYNITLSADDDAARQHFESVASLVALIEQHKEQTA